MRRERVAELLKTVLYELGRYHEENCAVKQGWAYCSCSVARHLRSTEKLRLKIIQEDE